MENVLFSSSSLCTLSHVVTTVDCKLPAMFILVLIREDWKQAWYCLRKRAVGDLEKDCSGFFLELRQHFFFPLVLHAFLLKCAVLAVSGILEYCFFCLDSFEHAIVMAKLF